MRRNPRRWRFLLMALSACLMFGACKKSEKLPDAPTPKQEIPAAKTPEMTATPEENTMSAPIGNELTMIAPYLDEPMAAGKNLVWCATLQLAWNKLAAFAGTGGVIQIEGDSPLAAMLNQQTATNIEFDAEHSVVIAGAVGAETLSEIERAKQKFDAPMMDDAGTLPQGSIMAYAFMQKTLPFAWAFTRFEMPQAFAGQDVAYFGVQQHVPGDAALDKMAAQVVILDYNTNNDFIIELKTTSAQDRLILAKIAPGKTLKETMNAALSRTAQAQPGTLAKSETLAIPVIDFERMREFQELQGRKIMSQNPAANGAQFSRVTQRIRFKLDETGAALESEAALISALPPRQFVFDQPFLVLLMRQGAAQPYFAAWIENSDALVPFQQPE